MHVAVCADIEGVQNLSVGVVMVVGIEVV